VHRIDLALGCLFAKETMQKQSRTLNRTSHRDQKSRERFTPLRSFSSSWPFASLRLRALLIVLTTLTALTFFGSLSQLQAGSYAPAAGQSGSEAIASTDSRIIGWATSVLLYSPGSNVDPMWQDTSMAVGLAEGNSFDVVSLGRGGSITLQLASPVNDSNGPDLAIFENSFSDTFLELAFVEVSSDGVNFTRFPSHSQTAGPVAQYGTIDPTNLDGLAGKYRQGFGTPFDLADVNMSSARYIRIIDIVGNGTATDSQGNIIFDPYATIGSAGFDLDGIAALQNSGGPGGGGTNGMFTAIDFSINLDASGTPTIQTFTEAGYFYSLESTTTFGSNDWSAVGSGWLGSNNLRTWPIPAGDFNAIRFKRLNLN